METNRSNVPTPTQAITVSYDLADTESPHCLMVSVAAFSVTLSFTTLEELSAFVASAQGAFSSALTDAIQMIPPVQDTVSEEFIERSLGYLSDALSELDAIYPEIDMDSVSQAVADYIENMDSGDVEIDIDTDGLKRTIRDLQSLLKDKAAKLAQTREEAEARQRVQEEHQRRATEDQKAMAANAGADGHNPGDYPLQ